MICKRILFHCLHHITSSILCGSLFFFFFTLVGLLTCYSVVVAMQNALVGVLWNMSHSKCVFVCLLTLLVRCRVEFSIGGTLFSNGIEHQPFSEHLIPNCQERPTCNVTLIAFSGTHFLLWKCCETWKKQCNMLELENFSNKPGLLYYALHKCHFYYFVQIVTKFLLRNKHCY